MNDRFKFKGYWYNDVQKEWWVYDEPEFITGDGTAEIWSNTEGGAYPELPSDAELHLCQCTGLKDKNGKLIYEGDIINDKSNHIRVVVWEQDSFKYPALKTSRYFHSPISNKLEERKVDLRGKLTFQDNVYKCDKKHFEVIGNIYENKELLE